MELRDAQGVLLHAPEEPVHYLHGGYGGLLEVLEAALDGKRPGDTVEVAVEPDDAYGDYDPELVRLEDQERYGKGIAAGMEVEDSFDGEEARLYLVTDIADGKVLLDANHPLAGMGLHFTCKVLAVREASEVEIERGGVSGG